MLGAVPALEVVRVADQLVGGATVTQMLGACPFRIGERDAAHILDEIDARGPRLVALSGDGSTP
jgi:hypothetical protein